jgi:hypothetical protein
MVKEIVDRYQELVECQRCLPLKDKDVEQIVDAPTVEDKTLKDKDAEQPIIAPTVENKAGIASHSKHPIGSARNVKPPKQWSFDEDNALISLVKEYQSKEMTVTQVFEEVKSIMPLTHILYSRSEEAIGTHYRKLVNDQKCPSLRGSIARKGGGQADKNSVAARKGGGQADKKSVAARKGGPSFVFSIVPLAFLCLISLSSISLCSIPLQFISRNCSN